jgi:hypothetical protein
LLIFDLLLPLFLDFALDGFFELPASGELLVDYFAALSLQCRNKEELTQAPSLGAKAQGRGGEGQALNQFSIEFGKEMVPVLC